MLFKIAIKSLFASKLRSILTMLLSIISTIFLIYYVSMMNGSYSQMIKDTVEIYTGYIEIMGKEYKENPNYDNLIFDVDKIEKELNKIDDIKNYTTRFEAFVLFASNESSVGGQLVGVEPKKEELTSRIKKSLVEGEYLSDSDYNEIYIGSDLAKKLGVSVGDKISYISSGVDLSFSADYLIVKGIFKIGINEFDGMVAFINKSFIDEAFMAENMATHIIIYPKEIKDSEKVAEIISNKIDGEVSVYSWQKLLISLLQAIEIDRAFAYVVIAIFFAVVFFVIMIYSLISVFTRIKEIGILRAIGTKPHQIVTILLFESAVLALISIIIGGVIGGYISWYFEINPIYLSGYEDAMSQYGEYGYAIEPIIPTSFSLYTIFYSMAFVFIVNILAVIYPILKINSLKPTEAISGM